MKQGFCFPPREQVVKHLPACNCTQVPDALVWEKGCLPGFNGHIGTFGYYKMRAGSRVWDKNDQIQILQILPKDLLPPSLPSSLPPPYLPSFLPCYLFFPHLSPFSLSPPPPPGFRCFIINYQALLAYKPTELTNAGQTPSLSFPLPPFCLSFPPFSPSFLFPSSLFSFPPWARSCAELRDTKMHMFNFWSHHFL